MLVVRDPHCERVRTLAQGPVCALAPTARKATTAAMKSFILSNDFKILKNFHEKCSVLRFSIRFEIKLAVVLAANSLTSLSPKSLALESYHVWEFQVVNH